MNILLIKQTSLGDVVHATAPIRSVRVAYPDALITVLTSTTASDILSNHPDINHLLTFDRYRVKSDWWRRPVWTLGHFVETFSAVRRPYFDLAIDLQGSWKTVIFLWAARATRRYVKGRWWFAEGFHQPMAHAIDEMGGVLELAGIKSCHSLPMLSVDPHVAETVSGMLPKLTSCERPIALLCPFTRWPTKNWPISKFALLAEQLAEEFQVIFTGSTRDRLQIDEVIAGHSPVSAVNLAGRLSLTEFFALAARSEVVVTGDSLPMHVASAFDRPLVSLFGPTNELLVGPRNDTAKILRAAVDCQRCYRRRRCPRACIDKITVDEVRMAVRSVLEQ
ncbi:MAG TPA: hypothetical protein DHW07_05495 [Gammaproteobacteria bacterium]|nr:hypothetical protein [Gammaproteobacteria bacterium]|tara:strand:- start:860 stop:1864 length:1005 start_codon:yes stop_codon:yes gene_type:complete